jgi:hypothetical protein
MQRNNDQELLDFEFQDEGSIVLLVPKTKSARTWAKEHIGRKNGYQPLWPNVIIEHRYFGPILSDILAEGFYIGG